MRACPCVHAYVCVRVCVCVCFFWGGGVVLLGGRGVTESKFPVNGWNFGREGRVLCVCVFGGGGDC